MTPGLVNPGQCGTTWCLCATWRQSLELRGTTGHDDDDDGDGDGDDRWNLWYSIRYFLCGLQGPAWSVGSYSRSPLGRGIFQNTFHKISQMRGRPRVYICSPRRRTFQCMTAPLLSILGGLSQFLITYLLGSALLCCQLCHFVSWYKEPNGMHMLRNIQWWANLL